MFVVVESEAAHRARRLTSGPLRVVQTVHGPAAHILARHVAMPGPRPQRLADGFWTTAVLDTLSEHGAEPVRITTLVNATVKIGNFSRRDDRIAKKLELFRLVGQLIRRGRLRRVARNFVRMPRPEERPVASLAPRPPSFHLPAPNI